MPCSRSNRPLSAPSRYACSYPCCLGSSEPPNWAPSLLIRTWGWPAYAAPPAARVRAATAPATVIVIFVMCVLGTSLYASPRVTCTEEHTTGAVPGVGWLTFATSGQYLTRSDAFTQAW